jgi:glycosyltransferase involved in cell wall biosynthesis
VAPRVLYLTHDYPSPELPVSGIFIREHARAALAAGVDVRVVHLDRSPGRRGLFDQVRVAGEEIPTLRVRYRRYGRPLSYAAYLAGAHAAFRRLRREGFDPDVLHAHHFLAALPGLALKAVYRKPLVYTDHWTIFLPENPDRLSPAMFRAAKLALERADLVLPVSRAWADAVARAGVQARFRIVPNVVDTSLFGLAGDGRNGGPPYRLLTVSHLKRGAKGIDVLLQALAALRDEGLDLRLDLVGEGDERPGYEELAGRLHLDSAVAFRGNLPKTEVAELMRRADLFVLASRYENSPCVLIESMASGLPVVATRVGGVPELVDGTAGVLAEPGDPAAFAGAVREALGRLGSFERPEMARRAAERFGREHVGKLLADVYAEVA